MFNYYVEGRVFEWAMALGMFFAGIQLLVWGETLQASAFVWLLDIMPQLYIGLFMLIIGWFRISSLMLNGHTVGMLKIGPWVRAVCSVFSSFMWVQFALALLQLSLKQGYPSVGLPFWSMFTIAELYVAYTTVKNA